MTAWGPASAHRGSMSPWRKKMGQVMSARWDMMWVIASRSSKVGLQTTHSYTFTKGEFAPGQNRVTRILCSKTLGPL